MYSTDHGKLAEIVSNVLYHFKHKESPYRKVTDSVLRDKKTGEVGEVGEVSEVSLLNAVKTFTRLSQIKRNDHATEFGPMCVWDVSGPGISFVGACSVDATQKQSPFNSDLYWDTSAATDMSYMFYENNEFHGDLAGWDVRNVTNMESMFSKSGIVDSGIDRWILNGDATTVGMLRDAKHFAGDLNRSAWSEIQQKAAAVIVAIPVQVDALDALMTRLRIQLGHAGEAAAEPAHVKVALHRKLVASLKSATVGGEGGEGTREPMYGDDEKELAKLATTAIHKIKKGGYRKVTDSVGPDKKTGEVFLANAVNKFRRLSQIDRNTHAETYGPMCVWDVGGPGINFFSACSVDAKQNQQPFHSDLYWDTSAATDMTDMFLDNEEFHGDLAEWDVRKVTKMKGMFMASGIVDSGIGNWNVSELRNADRMFEETNLSRKLDLSTWDVRNCTTLKDMFNSSSVVDSGIGSWRLNGDATTVNMFRDAKQFVGDLSGWSKPQQTDARKYNRLDELMTRLKIPSGKGARDTLTRRLFTSLQSATVSNKPMYGSDSGELRKLAKTAIDKIENGGYAKIIDMLGPNQDVFVLFTSLQLAGRIEHAETYGPMCVWDLSGLVTLRHDMAFLSEMDGRSLFNSDLYWDTSGVTNMADTFRDNQEFRGSLVSWDVSKVVTMNAMFRGSLIEDWSWIGNWDVSELHTAVKMFFGAKNLNKTLNLSNWEVQKCMDFSQMFGYSSVVDSNIGKWELHEDASVVSMFSGSTKFKGNLTGWSERHQDEAKAEVEVEAKAAVNESHGSASRGKKKLKKPPGVLRK
jgi:surface protein